MLARLFLYGGIMANSTGFNTGGGSGNAKKPYIKGGWNDPNKAEVVTPVYRGGWNDPNRAEVVTPVFTDSTTKTPTTGNTSNYGYNGGAGISTNAMATPSNPYASLFSAPMLFIAPTLTAPTP